MRIVITFCFYLASVVICFSQVLEAESGTLAGTQVSAQRAGYSGLGFVTGFDTDGDKVTMSTDINKSGIYKLYIRYASPSGEKFNFVFVNGQNLGTIQFPMSLVFQDALAGKVFLEKGANTISVVKDWGYFDLDNIRLELSEPADIHRIAANLVTPTPSDKTSSLYQFLSKTYGKVILSGQYGGAVELDRIQNVSGKLPLIRGFDLMEYSPSRVEHGATSMETENAIAWNSQRGVVTFSWHWNAPKDLIDQPGKEWWRGFYTDATTFDVTKAMNDVSSEEYTLIIRDIDAIAVQLKKLKDANVPVLWRPLHESEGKWFWWGAKGPEPCKWLWKLVFDRLVNHHQLDNLVWVWTSTGAPSALEWYPGNDCVDIIGADIYLPPGTYSSNFITADNMVTIYEGKKIITLSETGTIPDPDRLFLETAAWNWFCTWSGSFITDGISNSTAHINTVYNHEYVITLDEQDNVDNIMAALEEKKNVDDGEVILSTDQIGSSFITYQNPIRNNRLILKMTGPQPISNVVIYNTQGQEQFDAKDIDYRERILEFDFQDKNAGVYLLKVATPTFIRVIRIIKL